MNNKLNDKIISVMAEHNLTLDDIAKAIGVSNGAVSGWTHGVVPRPAKLKKLTDYLDSFGKKKGSPKPATYEVNEPPAKYNTRSSAEEENIAMRAVIAEKDKEIARLHDTIRAMYSARPTPPSAHEFDREIQALAAPGKTPASKRAKKPAAPPRS